MDIPKEKYKARFISNTENIAKEKKSTINPYLFLRPVERLLCCDSCGDDCGELY
jgi:hypothetical protein